MRSHLKVAMFLASLTVLAATPPAQAAFPGKNGKFAFVRNGEIWSMNPDGTSQTLLASPPVDPYGYTANGFPAWSPDGHRIAFSQSFFTGNDEEGEDVFVMNSDGSGQTNITPAPGPSTFEHDPAWSPDGTKIAFHRGGYAGDIYTMNADGSGITRITTQANFQVDNSQPSWSPGGAKIAFASNRDNTSCVPVCHYEIYVMNADGSAQTRLTNDLALDILPNWSPDGTKIAYQTYRNGNYEIDTINADGSSPTPLATGAGAAWSPDGRKIAFNRAGEIWAMNADGSGQADLGVIGGNMDWQPLPTPHPQTASQLNLSLVPAFKPCGTGGNPSNAKHAPPLATNSCNPPKPGSVLAAVGGSSQSSALMSVTPGDGDPTNGNQANVSISANLTDIQSTAGGDYNPNASGADLTAVTRLRFTDMANGDAGLPATATEYDFKVPIDCSSTGNPKVGSTCSANTTANALVPGLIQEQRQTIIQAFRVRIDDSGANGIRGDGDDRIFATQGVFVP